MHHRNEALEQAIIDAPDDPAPRLVYGDWLQAAGDVRGEWMTLSAAIAANPDDIKLRSAALAFLAGHRRELLGDGGKLLAKSWIGWHTGFIDELRVQPVASPMIVAKLLAHPSCRFIRHVAIGNVAKADRVIGEVVRAAPPLLESVLALDANTTSNVDLDPLADLPMLRRLGHDLANVRRSMPQLVELVVTFSPEAAGWIARGSCPNVTELTVLCSRAAIGDALLEMLRALPALRRLRLVELRGTDAFLARLDLGRLELLDLSHCDLTAAAPLLEAPPGMQILALHTRFSPGDRAKLTARGAIVSTGDGGSFYELTDEDEERSWIAHRVRTEGRAAVRLVPTAGVMLYNLGTIHVHRDRLEEARPLIEAALTFPDPRTNTLPLEMVGILHERRHDFDRADLFGREGILRDPDEPNFYAIVIDALRRSDRLDQALALVPRTLKVVERDRDSRPGNAAAALNDCLVTLLQAGRAAEVVAHAERLAAKASSRTAAIVAHAHVTLGDVEAATASLKKAKRYDVFAIHARAVWLAAKGKLADAIKELAKIKGYAEWHWVARDPCVAPLADKPAFHALFA